MADFNEGWEEHGEGLLKLGYTRDEAILLTDMRATAHELVVMLFREPMTPKNYKKLYDGVFRLDARLQQFDPPASDAK